MPSPRPPRSSIQPGQGRLGCRRRASGVMKPSLMVGVLTAALLLATAGSFHQCATCLICNTVKEPAVTLYTRGKDDGLGSAGVDIINAAAIASKLGWKFGGAVGDHSKVERIHRAQFPPVLDFMFVNHSSVSKPTLPQNMLLVELNPQDINGGRRVWRDTTRNATDALMKAYISGFPPAKVYYWTDKSFEPSPNNMDYFFPSSFLVRLRLGASCGIREILAKTEGAGGSSHGTSLRIVAHVRRGDSDMEGNRNIFQSHREWYFAIMAALRDLHPNAAMRAFTSCDNGPQCTDMHATEVPKWRENGITLQVDDERKENWRNATREWKTAFAYMVSADIFIMAKSSFSHLAALFNPNCVIRDPTDTRHSPLSQWIEVQGFDPQDGSPHKGRTTIDWFTFDGTYDRSRVRVVGRKDEDLWGGPQGLALQLKEALRKCLPENAGRSEELSSGSGTPLPTAVEKVDVRLADPDVADELKVSILKNRRAMNGKVDILSAASQVADALPSAGLLLNSCPCTICDSTSGPGPHTMNVYTFPVKEGHLEEQSDVVSYRQPETDDHPSDCSVHVTRQIEIAVDQFSDYSVTCRSGYTSAADTGSSLAGGQPTPITLFTTGKRDGIGSVGVDIVYAAAIASALGWTFGGAVGDHLRAERVHPARFTPIFDFLFGDHDAVSPRRVPPHVPVVVVNLPKVVGNVRLWSDPDLNVTDAVLRSYVARFPPATAYHLTDQTFEPSPNNIDYFFPERFLSRLRLGASCNVLETMAKDDSTWDQPWGSRGPVLRVVAHVRRGDSDIAGTRNIFATHPKWYFAIMAAVRESYPTAIMRAFTSCENKEQCDEMRLSEVAMWAKNGIKLRVDDERNSDVVQVTEEWKSAFAHMATADIFIMAKSGFSQLAAFFNPNCVLHNPADVKHTPRSKWIEVLDHNPPRNSGKANLNWAAFDRAYNVSKVQVAGYSRGTTRILAVQIRKALSTCLPVVPAPSSAKRSDGLETSRRDSPFGRKPHASSPTDSAAARYPLVVAAPSSKTDLPQTSFLSAQNFLASVHTFLADAPVARDSATTEPCPCMICDFTAGKMNVMTLYTNAKTDGYGSIAVDIIYAAALAARLGWRFGGIIRKKEHIFSTRHNVRYADAMDIIFGDGARVGPELAAGALELNLKDINRGSRPWLDGSRELTVAGLQAYVAAFPKAKGSAYLLRDKVYEPDARHVDFLMSEAFLGRLRAGALCSGAPNEQQAGVVGAPVVVRESDGPRALRVVAHLRRGDAEFEANRANFLVHRQWYFTIVAAIRAASPSAECAAFTSCDGDAQCFELAKLEVPIWKAKGIALRVDDERTPSASADWKAAFSAMATADVFIMGKSSFSHVAAMINPHCVIRNPSDIKHVPLPRWVEVDDKGAAGEDAARAHINGFHLVDWAAFGGEYDEAQVYVVGAHKSQPFGLQLVAALHTCLQPYLHNAFLKKVAVPSPSQTSQKVNRPSDIMSHSTHAWTAAGGVVPDECECAICSMGISGGGDRATKQLFTRAMNDGVGSTAVNIIYAAALAAQLNWTFAGAVGSHLKAQRLHSSHADATEGHSFFDVALTMIFGNASSVALLHLPSPQDDIAMVHVRSPPWADASSELSVGTLQDWVASSMPPSSSKRVFWEEQSYEPAPRHMEKLLTPRFLATLRRGAACGVKEQLTKTIPPLDTSDTSGMWGSNSTPQTGGALRVVAHYRRGDADRQNFETRAKLMSHPHWFFAVAQALAQLHPGADLRAFTSCASDDQCAELAAKEVPRWKHHGFILRVDDERSSSATEDWKNAFAHMATADIFIMAKSSFSQLAALLNPGCVIRNPSDVKHSPLARWVEVADPGVPAGEETTEGGLVEWHTFTGRYDAAKVRVVGGANASHHGTAHHLLAAQLRVALASCLPSSYRTLA